MAGCGPDLTLDQVNRFQWSLPCGGLIVLYLITATHTDMGEAIPIDGALQVRSAVVTLALPQTMLRAVL